MGDNYGGGVNAANYIGEFLGGKGDLAVLRSYVGTPIDLERYSGFTDTLKKYPDMKILVEGDGEFNQKQDSSYDRYSSDMIILRAIIRDDETL